MTTEPITLLYVGCREGGRGEPLQHLWHDLAGISNDGTPLSDDHNRHQVYGKKKKGHSTQNIAFASPGAIYSFEHPKAASIQPLASILGAGPVKRTW